MFVRIIVRFKRIKDINNLLARYFFYPGACTLGWQVNDARANAAAVDDKSSRLLIAPGRSTTFRI